MIADAVSIHKNAEDEYIIKNSETGRYIKAGEKEVAFFILFDEESRFDLEIDRMAFMKLSEEEKNYLTIFFKKACLWDNDLHDNGDLDKNGFIKKIKLFIRNISMIKLVNFNPDIFLSRTKKCFDWLFTVPAVILYIALVVVGEVLLLKLVLNLDFDALFHIDAKSMVLLMLTILPTGMIHEYAHSIACKHYGGEVKKMGFLLFYFLPAFYADVSDVYLIKRRKHRIIVCLAGVISNVILGNISLIIFCILYLNNITVYFFFYYYVINVGTAIYNLFPFVKMDGYWILQSIFSESNLMDKSKTMLFMMIFKNRTYRDIFNDKKGLKRLYLLCGLMMVVFSLLFWYYGISTIYALALRNLGKLAAQVVCFLLVTLIIASLFKEFIRYKEMVRENRFNWS